MMSRQPDTGESASAINRRADDQALPTVLDALKRGASLFRPNKLNRFYVDLNGDLGGGSLSRSRVKKLEAEGILQHVGVDRYGLKAGGAK